MADVSGNASQIQGDVSHDSADTGAPVKIGAVARSTFPAAVASADRASLIADLVGRLYIILGDYINVDGVSLQVKQAAIDETGSAQEVIAAVSSKKIRVVAITFTCSAACTVEWLSASTSKIAAMSFAVNGGMDVNRMPHGFFVETAVTEALKVTISAGNIRGSLCYVEV